MTWITFIRYKDKTNLACVHAISLLTCVTWSWPWQLFRFYVFVRSKKSLDPGLSLLLYYLPIVKLISTLMSLKLLDHDCNVLSSITCVSFCPFLFYWRMLVEQGKDINNRISCYRKKVAESFLCNKFLMIDFFI